MVYKGIIASIEGNKARIIPDETPEKTIPDVVIPSNLRAQRDFQGNLIEKLHKNDAVLFAAFTDGEGIIISRMDGEYNG